MPAFLTSVLITLGLLLSAPSYAVLKNYNFGARDAVLVVDGQDRPIYRWQEEKLLVPASLTKLVSTHLALDKWGPEHQFKTDFYILGEQLWVKGYGDPFLISEEIDLMATALIQAGASQKTISSIHLDNSFYQLAAVPGRTSVVDPYNAPLSAISANFNTVKLTKANGILKSAEPQTPLTPTARRLAKGMRTQTERVNLKNEDNAQTHFAEILSIKLGLKDAAVHTNQILPEVAQQLYQHQNSNALDHLLRGALEYSNNFIANQLYLNLAQQQGSRQLSFVQANKYAQLKLSEQFGWTNFSLEEGSGLSRNNRFNAAQIQQVLTRLKPNKTLLKEIKVNQADVSVHAKTGTLDGVRSYAGYIDFPDQSYQFVFIFNRQVPYGYRDSVLKNLIKDLINRQ